MYPIFTLFVLYCSLPPPLHLTSSFPHRILLSLSNITFHWALISNYLDLVAWRFHYFYYLFKLSFTLTFI